MNLSDKIAVVFGVLSGILWLGSAFVKMPFGYDNDIELMRAYTKASWINASAAICSAVSVIAANAANLSKLLY